MSSARVAPRPGRALAQDFNLGEGVGGVGIER